MANPYMRKTAVISACRELHDQWRHAGRPGFAESMKVCADEIEQGGATDGSGLLRLLAALTETNLSLRQDFFDLLARGR